MEGRQEPKSIYQIYNPDPFKYIIHGHNPILPMLSRISKLSRISRLSRIPRLSRLPMLNIVSLLMSLFIAVQLLWFETDPRLPMLSRLPMLNIVRFKCR